MIHKRIYISYTAYFETYIMDSEINYRQFRKRPAIIIAPGGAYAVHARKESEPVAIQFMQKGYQVFILKYSIGSDRDHPEKGILKYSKYPIQVVEMFETIHKIKENADLWNIDINKIFLMGFSAGGHVCASCGVKWNNEEIIQKLSFVPKEKELKVNGIVLGYPFLVPNTPEFTKLHQLEGVQKVQPIMNYVLYQTDAPSQEQLDQVNLLNYVSEETVPMFIWHSIDDPVIDSTNSTKFISKLLKKGVEAEYHLFGHGEHGKSLENTLTHMSDEEIDYDLNKWIELADCWIKRIGRD